MSSCGLRAIVLPAFANSIASFRKLRRIKASSWGSAAADRNRKSLSRLVNATSRLTLLIAWTGFREWKGSRGWKDCRNWTGSRDWRTWKALTVPGANVWKWEGQGPGNDGFVFALGNNRRLGVSTVQLTKQLADYFGISDGKGVLVTAVSDNSPAAKAGLKAGDVITAVDGETIEGPGDLSRALNKNKDGDVTVVTIRDKKQRTIKVTPEKAQSQVIRPGRVANQQIRDQIRNSIRRGVADGVVVVPRIEIPTIPAVDISTPRIEFPVIPEIRVVVPKTPRVRVIRTPSSQPI